MGEIPLVARPTGAAHDAHVTELLRTKLYAPLPRPDAVERVRLLERMERGAMSRLTLVSAPPGFGKTTLVPVARRPGAGAVHGLGVAGRRGRRADHVLGLRRRRRAPRSHRAGGHVARSLLESGPATVDRAIAALLNDLSRRGGDLVLVLDDFHVIEDPAIHERLAFLLDHLPPRAAPRHPHPVRPAAAARAPAGPGRARRDPRRDLRFTTDEAAAYLNERMGLGPGGRGRRGARGADRGLDRRPAARRALDAGSRRTRPRSSRRSRATTASSSTTSPTRCSRTSPRTSGTSSCGPRSSTGSPGPCATP